MEYVPDVKSFDKTNLFIKFILFSNLSFGAINDVYGALLNRVKSCTFETLKHWLA